MLIPYPSQCSVHWLYEAIQVSLLGCFVTSETAILQDSHTISGVTSIKTPSDISFTYKELKLSFPLLFLLCCLLQLLKQVTSLFSN